MLLPGNGGEIYRFGAFELALGTGELRKNGLGLKLQDQPVKLLVLLLENAGEVVTWDQIQERLWAGDVHADYENAFNSAVRKLREVLIDTSENPRGLSRLWLGVGIGLLLRFRGCRRLRLRSCCPLFRSRCRCLRPGRGGSIGSGRRWR